MLQETQVFSVGRSLVTLASFLLLLQSPMDKLDVSYHADLPGIIPYEFLVAGDISADGRRILLRSGKNRGAWMWTRNPQEETVEDALMGPSSCNLQLHDEEQGEAIAVHVAGEGFYTTSEGEEAPIYYYQFL